MGFHIVTDQGNIAETVLMPGDPLRAKHIAEAFLTDVKQYNSVRNMLGFTGMYKGKRVSVQGSGMGIPSISIYATELFMNYGVKNIIRIGTAGSFQPDIHIKDIVMAVSSCTDASFNKIKFSGCDYAPTANFDYLVQAYNIAKENNFPLKAGIVYSSDIFYGDDPNFYKVWADHGVLAVDMETSALYTIAAKFKARALTFLTISDSLVTGEAASSAERETIFHDAVKIALELD
ncbi:MAG: purine-nucleoside phosphorylase [Saprospiraceae bacterium]|jgi:purine-nucleoside phosphorylase|nr:purine-nucleoside phosphorylase [Saprospiraceae bacterium]